MRLFLGIDGGGTGCRAAIADAEGNILATADAGPANISSDPATARDNILAAAREALGRAIGAGGVAAELPKLTVGMGLAGTNAAGATGRLTLNLPFRRIRVETDAIAAVKGALGDLSGIVAAIGTGSVFARQDATGIRQIGGWGLVLGDDGSGAWLGRALLRETLRAAEGFTEATPLTRDVLQSLGGRETIIGFSVTAKPADFAALAPRLLSGDDPVARALMTRATEDIAASIANLQGDDPLAVSYIGGLGPTFEARLRDRWAARPALGTALDGALWLARSIA
jgi:glucosamine kinase